MRRRIKLGLTATLAALAVGGWLMLAGEKHRGDGAANAAEINIPAFSPVALNGKAAFEAN